MADIEELTSTCPDDPTQIGQAKGCTGCPGQEYCRRVVAEGKSEAQEMLEIRMNVIKHKIVVMSGKGGVGKSSVACQLAAALALQGNKVGILDLDLCGPSVAHMMGVPQGEIIQNPWGWSPVVAAHGVSVMSVAFMLGHSALPVVWRGPRKTQMILRYLRDVYWGQLDYLIIDTPPGTSDEHLTVATALKDVRLDGAVIVTTPQEVALDTIRREFTFCKKMRIRVLGIVENMSGFACPCCGQIEYPFKKDGGKNIAAEYNVPFLGAIPIDTKVGNAAEQGQFLAEVKDSEGARALQAVVDAIGVQVKSS